MGREIVRLEYLVSRELFTVLNPAQVKICPTPKSLVKRTFTRYSTKGPQIQNIQDDRLHSCGNKDSEVHSQGQLTIYSTETKRELVRTRLLARTSEAIDRKCHSIAGCESMQK